MKIKYKKTYFAIAFFLIPCFCLQLILSNRLTKEGTQLENFEKEIIELEEKNNYIKNSLASMSGLINLKQIANTRGFIENPIIVNLTTKAPVALK